MSEKITNEQLEEWQAAYDKMMACPPWNISMECSEISVANVKFIAAANKALPALIAEVKRLRDKIGTCWDCGNELEVLEGYCNKCIEKDVK